MAVEPGAPPCVDGGGGAGASYALDARADEPPLDLSDMVTLERVVRAWATLPDPIKAAVRALVMTCTPTDRVQPADGSAD